MTAAGRQQLFLLEVDGTFRSVKYFDLPKIDYVLMQMSLYTSIELNVLLR